LQESEVFTSRQQQGAYTETPFLSCKQEVLGKSGEETDKYGKAASIPKVTMT
jgi:hypothetical protein